MSTPFCDNINKLTLEKGEMPEVLVRIPSPPKQLFVAGTPLEEILNRPCVAIVGSRNLSAYGREATMKLASDLAARGIVIVSGLALGVDSVAHRAALEAGGTTVAVLPSPIEKIYPASHTSLAAQIVERGGTLVSEYPEGTDMFRTRFIARNRLIAGLANVLLVTEAAEKSGSLHTARFALEQGKDVMAVPGSIFSLTSVGTNNLLKSGAAPITSYLDVLHALSIEEFTPSVATTHHSGSNEERLLLKLLANGHCDGDTLLEASGLDITAFNQALTMLEITGHIRSLGANQWSIR
jgi:DNA processing protein